MQDLGRAGGSCFLCLLQKHGKTQGSEEGTVVTSCDSKRQPPPLLGPREVGGGVVREACILVYLHWRINQNCVQLEMEIVLLIHYLWHLPCGKLRFWSREHRFQGAMSLSSGVDRPVGGTDDLTDSSVHSDMPHAPDGLMLFQEAEIPWRTTESCPQEVYSRWESKAVKTYVISKSSYG